MQLDIFKCIASYLLQNESVSILGLGSFYLKDLNVDFVKGKNILHPPRKSVIFDQSGREDLQFIRFLSEKLNLTLDIAKSQLDTFVQQVNHELEQNKRLNFPGLGEMTKNNENRLFNPLSSHLHPDYLYYPSIPLRPIPQDLSIKTENIGAETKIGKVSAIHKERAPVLTEKTVVSTRKESIMEENNYQPNPHYYEEEKGLFSAIGWPLFGLILLGLLFFFGIRAGCNALSDGAKAATEVVGDVTDTAENVINQATDAVSGNSDSQGYTGKYSDVLTQDIIDQGCVIVVGSFKKSRNALRMRERIIAKGYQPYDEYHNGLNRVGLIFDCLDKDLVDFLQEIRRNIEPKAWYRIPGFEVAYE